MTVELPPGPDRLGEARLDLPPGGSRLRSTGPFELTVEPSRSAPRIARERLQQWLIGLDCPSDVIADIVLVVSELVANVIRHTSSAARLCADCTDDRLRLEVHDTSDRPPILGVPTPSVATVGGYGLHVVASLADDWGWSPTPEGKQVWTEHRIRLATADIGVTVGRVSREVTLARTLLEFTDSVVDDFGIVDLLMTLSDRCVEVLDVAAAGILLVAPDDHLRVMCSSSEATQVVELFEIQGQQGPGLECWRTGRSVVNEDLDAPGNRWPRFAIVAVAAGFRAVDAIPLRLRGDVIGVLNLFRRGPTSLGRDDVITAQAFADLAAIAILQHHAINTADDFRTGLAEAFRSRVLVEQAKGMIAERHNINTEQAFDLLRGFGRAHDRKLASLAASIVGGTLDPTELTLDASDRLDDRRT